MTRSNAGTAYPDGIEHAQVMVTDGGPHSPQKWAALVVNRLLYVGDKSQPDVIAAAHEYRQRLFEVMVGAFEHTIAAKRSALARGREIDLDIAANGVTSRVLDAARGTHFAVAMQVNSYVEQIHEVIKHHLGTILMIEDQWHDALGRPFGAD